MGPTTIGPPDHYVVLIIRPRQHQDRGPLAGRQLGQGRDMLGHGLAVGLRQPARTSIRAKLATGSHIDRSANFTRLWLGYHRGSS